jgi:hypothetical protein
MEEKKLDRRDGLEPHAGPDGRVLKHDEDVEAEWDAEIARRIRELDEGRVKLVPWAEVRRRLTRQRSEVQA